MSEMFKMHVLVDGYSIVHEEQSPYEMSANGTCSLIVGPNVNMVVDTMSPWHGNVLIDELSKFNLNVSEITHVVCTHGHPDHIGNNNLFTSAKLHIVGHSVYHKDQYYSNDLSKGEPYLIDGNNLYVLPTPGHTLDSVSVVVQTEENGLVCIAGDLFEKEADILEPDLWRDAGSEDEVAQLANRTKVLLMADFIVPGHGPMFAVTNEMKDYARQGSIRQKVVCRNHNSSMIFTASLCGIPNGSK